MPGSPLSPEVLKFIGLYIHSVEALEILCLLAGSPDRTWTAREVFVVIQSTETSVNRRLRKFAKDNIFAEPNGGSFRFLPSDELRAAAVALVGAYRERSVSVIEAIYARPSDAAQSFADAFLLRKEK